jgi:hypothetical protein
METPGMELRVNASCRYGSTDRRPHMHPSYYYFGAPDSDSADDSYDPTRECFQIDGAIVSDSEAEAAAGERNATPPHAAHPGDDARLLEADQEVQLQQIQELQAKLDEERERLRAHGGGARERARDVNRRIIEDKAGEPQSSTEPARTLSPPPCFSATCLNHLHPRPMMRFEVSSRLRPCSKPRVPP